MPPPTCFPAAEREELTWVTVESKSNKTCFRTGTRNVSCCDKADER